MISHQLVLTFYITAMALLIGYQLSLEDSDFVNTWLRCFAVSARTKKLKDNTEKGGEYEITDFFLATAGCELMMKDSTMAYPANEEDLTSEKMSNHRKDYATQEKVSCDRKNEVHVDKKRN